MLYYVARRLGEHVVGAVLVTAGAVFVKELFKEYAKAYHKLTKK